MSGVLERRTTSVELPRRGRYGWDAPYMLVLPALLMAIADLRNTNRYRDRLVGVGMRDVALRDLGWKMRWDGPWVPTKLVTARRAWLQFFIFRLIFIRP